MGKGWEYSEGKDDRGGIYRLVDHEISNFVGDTTGFRKYNSQVIYEGYMKNKELKEKK